VAQRFTAAIQALNFDGFSRWGTASFKLTHYPPPPTHASKPSTPSLHALGVKFAVVAERES
jgi:hypothetical protein